MVQQCADPNIQDAVSIPVMAKCRIGHFAEAQVLEALFDVFAMIVMSAVVVFIAIKAWPVVERSLVNGSRANTPLETPLAWVQLPWFAGWVWFAVMSCLVTLAALSLIVKRRHAETEGFVGAFAEQDMLK